MELLPAIDLRHGEVVRLRQGDDARRTVYSADPRAQLESFAAAGVRRVHVVDLDAAFGDAPQRSLLERLVRHAHELGIVVQLGGGLRDRASVEWAFELGAVRGGVDRGVIGSMVARDPDLFATLVTEHPGRIVAGLDFKDGQLAISGWRETSDESFDTLCARLRGLPCAAALVTDVRRDGELGGPNIELARRVAQQTGFPALLSGGVHGLDDLRQARRCPEIEGAIVGRALYDGNFTLEEALQACAAETPETTETPEYGENPLTGESAA